MSKDSANPLFHLPIDSLLISLEFKKMSQANGFATLQDLLKEPLHELPLKPKSGYRILRELLDILQENGLEDFADDWENA